MGTEVSKYLKGQCHVNVRSLADHGLSETDRATVAGIQYLRSINVLTKELQFFFPDKELQ